MGSEQRHAPGPVESLLRAAYGVYRERGGAVRTLCDESDRLCAIGALVHAAYEVRGYYGESANILTDAAHRMTGRVISASGFNDEYVPDYGPLPVRNLYRRAIALAQERGL